MTGTDNTRARQLAEALDAETRHHPNDLLHALVTASDEELAVLESVLERARTARTKKRPT